MNRRNLLSIFLKYFAYLWLFLGGAAILTGIVGVWMEDGFSGVQELMSPFNIINWIAIVITIAPGIWLLNLHEKVERNMQ